jgi:hypothetical protein
VEAAPADPNYTVKTATIFWQVMLAYHPRFRCGMACHSTRIFGTLMSGSPRWVKSARGELLRQLVTSLVPAGDCVISPVSLRRWDAHGPVRHRAVAGRKPRAGMQSSWVAGHHFTAWQLANPGGMAPPSIGYNSEILAPRKITSCPR